MWESAIETTESLSLWVERGDCCSRLIRLHCFCIWVKIAVLFNPHFWFYMLCRLEVFLSWYIYPKAVAILVGIWFNNFWLFMPCHVRKLPFLIPFRKFIGVGMKQHTWRYWISSVFVLSLVMISRAKCLSGLDMDMSHSPSLLFLFPFKIIALPLRIFIPFLYNMVIHSSSHSWPK